MPREGFAYFPYQTSGANWLAARKNAILGDEMGVGKSPTAILACDILRAKQVLVICPGVARENWRREFERWQDVPRKIGLIKTSKLLPATDVLIVSWSAVNSIRVLSHIVNQKWDVVIADEAHLGKNPAATRVRAIYGEKIDGKTGIASVTRHFWLLSGTLMPNGPHELWSHCAALFPDVSQGMTYDNWTFRYCVKDHTGTRVIGINKQTTPALAQSLRPHVLRRLSRDVQKDLPPLRFSNVPVAPDSLPEKSSELRETEAIVQAAMMKSARGQKEQAAKLLASAHTDHIASLRRWTGIAKVPAVIDLIKADFEAGMDRIVIFAYHQEVILQLLQAFPDAVGIYGNLSKEMRERWPDAKNVSEIQRQQHIDWFEGRGLDGRPRPNKIVASIDIASTALTLTSSANVGFAETTWVPKDVQQAAKRCHRHGQTRSVLARIFSLAGSVDDTISDVLARKARVIGDFNKALAG